MIIIVVHEVVGSTSLKFRVKWTLQTCGNNWCGDDSWSTGRLEIAHERKAGEIWRNQHHQERSCLRAHIFKMPDHKLWVGHTQVRVTAKEYHEPFRVVLKKLTLVQKFTTNTKVSFWNLYLQSNQKGKEGLEHGGWCDVPKKDNASLISLLNSSVRRTIFEQDSFRKTISRKISFKPDKIGRKQ